MTKDEKVLLAMVGCALLFVIIYRVANPPLILGAIPADAAESEPQEQTNVKSGPHYLTYNTPWAYNPALGNPMPRLTRGMIGELPNMSEDLS